MTPHQYKIQVTMQLDYIIVKIIYRYPEANKYNQLHATGLVYTQKHLLLSSSSEGVKSIREIPMINNINTSLN